MERSSKEEFFQRVRRPRLSDREHLRQRHQLYPTTPAHGLANDRARKGWESYKDRQEEDSRYAKDYENAEKRARYENEKLTIDELKYYKNTTAEYTPDQHRDLFPRARRWGTAARE